MKSSQSDTIVARATPPGRGGVGIIRISGQKVPSIAEKIVGKIPKPRYATYCNFTNAQGHTLDQGIALYFPAPHSFTGEDVLELQGHGGPLVMDTILARLLELDVRMARPGEFSERAFLNNKIDLTQAEAIADLIEASSEEAARSAIRSLQGEFSKEISLLVDGVISLRMYVEAAIDFPEEEIDFLNDGKILKTLQNLQEQLDSILQRAKQGRALNEGIKVVITGYPNAGKSSLLNLLCGDEAAIVSTVPGTTRDVLRETILIDGMPLQILDTAGLRESKDSIETEGIRRAWNEIPNADRILLVMEAEEFLSNIIDHPLVKQFEQYRDKLTIVRNKIDLINTPPTVDESNRLPIISLSAKTKEGYALLKDHLKDCMGYSQDCENTFIARRRHLEALTSAKHHFNAAMQQLTFYQAGELVAEELRQAQTTLAEITGEFRSDDLLGKIFSSFCIGK